jgi:hypothetical protein
MVFVYMLCGYHHKLLSMGQTTNENYKNTYRNNQDSPFNRFGYIKNFLRTFTRKVSKQLLDKSLLYEKKADIPSKSEHDSQGLESDLQIAPMPLNHLMNSDRSIDDHRNGTSNIQSIRKQE